MKILIFFNISVQNIDLNNTVKSFISSAAF